MKRTSVSHRVQLALLETNGEIADKKAMKWTRAGDHLVELYELFSTSEKILKCFRDSKGGMC